MAERVQLRRTKGWRKPEGAHTVARPTRWGNPFAIGDFVPRAERRFDTELQVRDRAHAVELYRRWLAARPALQEAARRELAGRDLACWCRLDQPCHADVLLELTNP